MHSQCKSQYHFEVKMLAVKVSPNSTLATKHFKIYIVIIVIIMIIIMIIIKMIIIITKHMSDPAAYINET